MKKLLELFKPYRKKLAAVLILDVFGMMCALILPYLMSEILERGVAAKNMDVVWQYGIIMLVLSVASAVIGIISAKLNVSITTSYTSELFQGTFEKINNLSYEDYSEIGPSGLLTRATDDIWNVEGAVTSLPYTMVTVPIMFIGSAVLSFMADGILSLIFMLSIPPVIALVLVLMRPLDGMWDKSDKYVDMQNKVVRERLSGLRVVRAFNKEAHEHGRAKTATEEMSKYMIRANIRGGMVDPFAMLLLNFATVAVVYFGGLRAETSSGMGSGDVIAVLQYVALLTNALINLSWTLAWLPRLKVSVKRINEIFSLPDEDSGDEKTATPEGFDLKLDNLTFSYPKAQSPSLRGISLHIGEGERVAIIGGTGSGKSTVAKLLLGLFSPTEGDIILGGVSYSDLSRATVRANISIATQKAVIFEGSVRDNVKMSKPDATDEEIMDVLMLSKMDDFVKSHKEGLDYLLVGAGQNVSGGQKQRLNMARAVIKQTNIYIFDDCFSALDFFTEKQIKENYDKILRGKSQIYITQRVSTAMSAERIYVMDGGKIVGEGSHSELVSSCPIYREIVESQLGKDAVGGDGDEE